MTTSATDFLQCFEKFSQMIPNTDIDFFLTDKQETGNCPKMRLVVHEVNTTAEDSHMVEGSKKKNQH